MDELIRLSPENYKKHLPIDIVAFSFAEPGAIGEKGKIIIISKDKKKFKLNYIRDNFNKEQLFDIYPVIYDCEFCFGGAITPANWFDRDLGFGNHLIVKEYLRTQFEEKTKNLKKPWEYYGQWEDTIMSILNDLQSAEP